MIKETKESRVAETHLQAYLIFSIQTKYERSLEAKANFLFLDTSMFLVYVLDPLTWGMRVFFLKRKFYRNLSGI